MPTNVNIQRILTPRRHLWPCFNIWALGAPFLRKSVNYMTRVGLRLW